MFDKITSRLKKVYSSKDNFNNQFDYYTSILFEDQYLCYCNNKRLARFKLTLK